MAPDREGIVHALMATPIVLNTGGDITPVGGRRPLSGTEANDVADLLTLGAIRETRTHDNPEREARWREVRNAIAFGAMASTSWGADNITGDDRLLDDLTDQYLAQDDTDRP